MLVLTRKLHEEILIGDDIRVQVVAIRNNNVRIGVVAPPHVQVLRHDTKRTSPGETTNGNG